MGKQRAAPAKSKQIQSAQEIVSLLKELGLPENDRLRLEGVIIGMDLAHKGAQPPAAHPSGQDST